MNSLEKLVYMANQIARNLETEGEKAADTAAAHIVAFWDPRMKTMILGHLDAGGKGLSPGALAALRQVRAAVHA